MDEKKFTNVPYGNPIFQSTDRIGWAKRIHASAEEKKLFSVFDFYLTHSILKEKERSGWKKWNVAGRRESVTDHISSAQALAWGLWSEYELDVDIFRVIAMLSVHEEGESIIGDITPYDGEATLTKPEREKMAINFICQKLKRGNMIVSLFDEFEAKETPEAKFAFLCDKLDCDLQAKLYSDAQRCTIQNATYEMVSNEEIQKIIKNGAKTVRDVFWESDKHFYEGTFLEEFFNKLKEL